LTLFIVQIPITP